MNDFEHKLRQQPFREPPPDLREAIFGAPPEGAVSVPWNWRDWFWPSPLAWGAVAALWAVFAALEWREIATERQAPVVVHEPPVVLLFAARNSHDFHHVLELAN